MVTTISCLDAGFDACESATLSERQKQKLSEVGTEIARGVRRIMIDLRTSGALQKSYCDIAEYYGRVFEQISAIRFAPLSSGAAFNLDTSSHRMTINIGHVEEILRAVFTDLHGTNQQAPTAQLSADQVPNLVLRTIILLILHEVSHIKQGIARYEDVQALKSVNLEQIIGDLDFIADMKAARGYALLENVKVGDDSILGYLRHFAEAIFFGGLYCFPAFGIPADKPHKVARALGSTLVLARYVIAERQGKIEVEHTGSLPLDTPLIPRIGHDFSSVTIFASTPDLEMYSQFTGLDPAWLQSVCAKLQSNFMGALEDCISLLRCGLNK